jgi:hypothetical protein
MPGDGGISVDRQAGEIAVVVCAAGRRRRARRAAIDGESGGPGWRGGAAICDMTTIPGTTARRRSYGGRAFPGNERDRQSLRRD